MDKKAKATCSLKEPHFKYKDRDRLKEQKKINHAANINSRNAGRAIINIR